MNFNCYNMQITVWITCFRSKNLRTRHLFYLPKASRGTPPTTWFRRGGGSWRRQSLVEEVESSGNPVGLKTPKGIPLLAVYTTEKKHLYIAFWGVICYLPPFMGTRNNHWNDSHLFFPLKTNFRMFSEKSMGVGSICVSPTKMFRPFEKGTNSLVFLGGFQSCVNKVEARWWNFNPDPWGRWSHFDERAYFSNGWQKKHQVEHTPPNT